MILELLLKWFWNADFCSYYSILVIKFSVFLNQVNKGGPRLRYYPKTQSKNPFIWLEEVLEFQLRLLCANSHSFIRLTELFCDKHKCETGIQSQTKSIWCDCFKCDWLIHSFTYWQCISSASVFMVMCRFHILNVRREHEHVLELV